MSEPQPTFAFLLGSGVSCAGKLPNVQKLSCAVSSTVAGTEARLLEVIKHLSAATHGDGRHSYEDCFFVADQLFQHESGDYENPALLPLIERLRCSLGVSNDEIRAIAESLCTMIGDIVSRELRTKDARPDVAFAGLVDAIREREGAKFRFFTLNHDILLESFLKKAGINPYMGLARHPKTSDYQRVRFSRAAFDEAAVSVVKLHGSVDWRRIRPMSSRTARNSSKGEFIGVKHPGGANDFEQMETVPRVLIGTSNKILG